MKEKEYVVCCTDRGNHGRVNFLPLVLKDSGEILEMRIRSARPPWEKDWKIVADGVVAPVPLGLPILEESARVPDIADERWRWRCPKCDRDKPLSGANLRAWMAATREEVLDISLLPRELQFQ